MWCVEVVLKARPHAKVIWAAARRVEVVPATRHCAKVVWAVGLSATKNNKLVCHSCSLSHVNVCYYYHAGDAATDSDLISPTSFLT